MEQETRSVRVMVGITPTQEKKLDKLRAKVGIGTTRSTFMQWLLEKAPSVPNKGYKK